MTETKFTPGPWVVGGYGDMTVYSGAKEICTSSWGKGVHTVSAASNAHLIAAAPELYEALVRMKEWCENEVGAELPCASIDAALAKARGEV